MPCYTDPPSERELTYDRLVKLVKELRLKYAPPSGVADGIQDMTRVLCTWCKTRPDQVKNRSLELQIWWRDHQAEDARHEKKRLAKIKRAKLKAQALLKLTADERKALGLERG